MLAYVSSVRSWLQGLTTQSEGRALLQWSRISPQDVPGQGAGGGAGRCQGDCGWEVGLGQEFFKSVHLALMVSTEQTILHGVLTWLCFYYVSMISTPKKPIFLCFWLIVTAL